VDARARLRNNPFFVLGVAPDTSLADAERAGRRLLGELAIGREAARRYATPLGPAERTEDAVRASLAELRDPARRLVHELWARVPVADSPAAPPPAIGWDDVAASLGVAR
jgi:hypothetical protein